MKKILIIGTILLFIGCFPIKTDDAEKAYRYWSGNKPPSEIKLIKGEYYQSPHFSLEYELFLKFKSNKKWFSEFIEHNGLEIDTIGNNWNSWTELPEWFNPNQDYLIYSKNQSDEFERSRYFRNPKTGVCYIYETVGM